MRDDLSHNRRPLVKGGQGRSPEDVERSAYIVCVCIGLGLLLIGVGCWWAVIAWVVG